MIKAIFTLMILLGAMITTTFSQLTPDAGPARVVCVDWNGIMNTIYLGGSPSASGGTSPYTYTWEAEYSWSAGNHTFSYSASDFLNDTTHANPKVVYAIGDTIEFRLTVTDADGNENTDTTYVYYAYFGSHLGQMSFTINQGDSIFLYGMQNVMGGFPPYEYLWRPNHGLTDSTSLAFWAKPEYSVDYYLTLTDSAGCRVIGAPVYFVSVIPLHADSFDDDTIRITVFPNPATDFLRIRIHPSVQGEFTFRLYSGNGKLIKQQQFIENEFHTDISDYPPGIYYYEIANSKGYLEKGSVVK